VTTLNIINDRPAPSHEVRNALRLATNLLVRHEDVERSVVPLGDAAEVAKSDRRTPMATTQPRTRNPDRSTQLGQDTRPWSVDGHARRLALDELIQVAL